MTLSPWTAPATPPAASELCSLDAINGEGAVNGGFRGSVAQGTTFEGWVSTPDMKAPGNIALVLDGPATDYQITGTTGQPRPDVAQAYGPGAANAGFKIELPELQVAPGEYSIQVVDAGGRTFICNTKAKLTVG